MLVIKQVKLDYPASKVFQVMSDNEDFSWRSDIVDITIEDESHFVEHYANGNATHFTITAKLPNKCYSFDMDHKMFYGSWIGLLEETEDEKCILYLTENITIKNPFLRMFGEIIFPVKKMQDTYVRDLQNKLNNLLWK